MMKKFIAVLLAILTVMTALVACETGNDEETNPVTDETLPTDSETTVEETTTERVEDTTAEETEPEPVIDPLSDLNNYKVVSGGNDAAAELLRKGVKAVCGVDLDANQQSAYQIELAVNETGLTKYDYTVKNGDTGIIITGGSADALYSAVERFLAQEIGYISDGQFVKSETAIFEFSDIRGVLPQGVDMLSEQKSLDNYPYYASLWEPTAEGEFFGVTGANAIFENFSGVSGTNCLVYQFGNEACYFEWVADKIMATGDAGYKNTLKNKIISYPQTDTGYMWSWSTSTYWPTGDGDMHYDGTFRYVAAVYDIIRWENSTDFLDSVCGSGSSSGMNGTRGMTVYEKCVLAMDYALNQLHGKDGVIQITEDSMLLSDGKTRIDEKDGKLLWNNTGCMGSAPSNYWDNLCFGNYDAYETALFYHALDSMACIEEMLGNQPEADKYRNIMKLVHDKYDEFFWDAEKGRYIACIDTLGNRIDFGFTFLNTEALYYGLGDKDKAEQIFSWIDGTRIVEGDTTTGEDVLSYTNILNMNYSKKQQVSELMFLAPITNTVKIESVKNEAKEYWWYSLNGAITVRSNAKYGKHLENGGYIFYTVFYELMARTKYLGADSTYNRYEQIAKVYDYNGLDSDIGTWVEGLCGEFPESGMASVPFAYALVGVDASADGLHISPSVPSKCKFVGVKDLCFANKKYTVQASDNTLTIIPEGNGLDLDFTYEPVSGTLCRVNLYSADGQLISASQVSADQNGAFHIAVNDGSAAILTLDVLG